MLKFPSLSLKNIFIWIDRELLTPKMGNTPEALKDAQLLKWGIFTVYFALILASIYAWYNRVVLGSFPRAVLEGECNSPESAKTMAELGYKKNPFVLFSLRFGSLLRREVSCVEAEAWAKENEGVKRSKFAEFWLPEKKYKINFETDRFYIPEDKKHRCSLRFEKKGNGVLPLIITAVGGFIAVLLAIRFAPDLINFLGGIFGASGESGVI